MTRDQLRRLHRLGTVRNANYILSDLQKYLHSFREGDWTVYYLSKAGKAYVDCQKVRKKGNKARHTVYRNELWFHFQCPSSWKGESKIIDPNTKKTLLISDASFQNNGKHYLVEVDLTQTMKENREKCQRYKELFEMGFQGVVVWITTTELRRKQLKEACKSFPSIIYTLSDIQ